MQYAHRVFVDIETITLGAFEGMDLTGTPPGWVCPEPGDPPANYKSEEAIARWRDREAEKAVKSAWGDFAAGALSPMTGRVLVIGMAVDDEVVGTIVAPTEADERDALEVLQAALVALHKDGPVQFIGHNLKAFDAPFLQLRGMRHRLRFPFTQAKKWDDKLVDTMELWPCRSSGFGLKGSARLTSICDFLGLDFPVDKPGSEVFGQFVAGDFQGIAHHCAIDVARVREVYRLMSEYRLIHES